MLGPGGGDADVPVRAEEVLGRSVGSCPLKPNLTCGHGGHPSVPTHSAGALMRRPLPQLPTVREPWPQEAPRTLLKLFLLMSPKTVLLPASVGI